MNSTKKVVPLRVKAWDISQANNGRGLKMSDVEKLQKLTQKMLSRKPSKNSGAFLYAADKTTEDVLEEFITKLIPGIEPKLVSISSI